MADVLTIVSGAFETGSILVAIINRTNGFVRKYRCRIDELEEFKIRIEEARLEVQSARQFLDDHQEQLRSPDETMLAHTLANSDRLLGDKLLDMNNACTGFYKSLKFVYHEDDIDYKLSKLANMHTKQEEIMHKIPPECLLSNSIQLSRSKGCESVESDEDYQPRYRCRSSSVITIPSLSPYEQIGIVDQHNWSLEQASHQLNSSCSEKIRLDGAHWPTNITFLRVSRPCLPRRRSSFSSKSYNSPLYDTDSTSSSPPSEDEIIDEDLFFTQDEQSKASLDDPRIEDDDLRFDIDDVFYTPSSTFSKSSTPSLNLNC